MSSVCLITNLSMSDEPTINNRLRPYISEFQRAAVDVTLISGDRVRIEDIDRSVRHHIFPSDNLPRSFIKRSFAEWLHAIKIMARARKLDCDVYLITIPSMFLALNIFLLMGKRCHLDIRDLTWEYLDEKNLFEYLAKRVLRVLIFFNLFFVQETIVTNQRERDYLRGWSKFMGGLKDILLYPNGVTSMQYKQLSTLSLDNKKSTTVTYCGKVGLAQKLESFVRAAPLVPDVIFKIVGYGPDTQRLEEYCRVKKISNVVFTGRQDWEGVLAHYQDSDIFYAQLADGFESAIPSKLYQYLATGRFVVFGGRGYAADFLSQFRGTYNISTGSTEHLVETLETLKGAEMTQEDIAFNRALVAKRFVREDSVSRIMNQLLAGVPGMNKR